jgi:Leucine-rich repeat (LRR) protein
VDPSLLAAIERDGGFAGVTALHAQGAGIRSIDGIEQCVALREVWLNGNPIADLSPLSLLEHLEALHVHQTLAVQPPDVGRWPGLRAFTFGLGEARVPFADLTVFSRHSKLGELRIDHANVCDLSALAHLPLTDLSLRDNLVEDIRPLAKIPSLWRLALDQNPLRDVDALLELPNLRRVYLVDTKAVRSKVLVALRTKGVDVHVTKRLPRPH